MTTTEFSNEFDVLYNNIMSNQAPGLDEYEKSVFLTRAQEDIITSYFFPMLNKSMAGFDESEKRQIDFSMLISSSSPTLENAREFNNYSNSRKALLPKDILFILNERIVVKRNNKDVSLVVVPINYNEYDRILSKPYKRPLHYQAWRLIVSNKERNAELVVGPNDTIGSYSLRYVKKPNPIILEDLEGVTIEGKDKTSECELDPILHKDILQRAVELAKSAYTGDLNSTIALGANSQTNIGYVGAQGQPAPQQPPQYR